MSRFLRALGCALLVVSIAAATATAAPVTVNLRVEGSTQTYFEGPVTTDARTIVTPSDPSPGHQCDVAHNGPTPPGGTPSPTPTTAIYDATAANGIAFDAQWFGSTPFGDIDDYFVNQVGTDVNQSSGSFASWGLAVDYQAISTGGCQVAATPGMDVLWAYDFFNKVHYLALSGPTSVNAGESVTFHVVDGQNNAPVQGATVNGATTDANGDATTSFGAVGSFPLKAEEPSSVRSNRLTVCVHNGDDGTCGTTAGGGGGGGGAGTAPTTPTSTTTTAPTTAAAPGAAADHTAPQGQIDGPADGSVFGHRRGPRLLRGHAGEPSTTRAVTLVPDPSGLSAVRLRLTRDDRGRCAYYSGRLERFVRARCGAAHGRYFAVGTDAAWSYLLPHRLPRGRYGLDVLTADKAGNSDTARRRGGNRVVFRVR